MLDRAIMNRNRNINRGYRKLEVWKEAISLSVFVKEKVRFLSQLPFKVRAQIEDSAFSVASNIAEGYARRSIKENIQFNTIALASLAENYTQIFTLFSGNDIEKEWFDQYDTRHYSVENKLLSLNMSQIEKLNNQEEWKSDYKISELVEPYIIKSESSE